MTNESELHTRIRQLEDEAARLRAVNENARAETARACLVAVWGNPNGQANSSSEVAVMIMDDVLALERAIIDQAQRERLGLGKQAEMENSDG